MRAVVLIALAWLWVACSFGDNVTHCDKDGDCGSQQRCYESFCVPSGAASESSSAQQASDAGNRVSTGPSANMSHMSASSGTGKTGAGGSGGASQSPTDGGAALPRADATTSDACKDDEDGPCLVDPTDRTLAEACNRGMRQCMSGQWGACVGTPMPAQEVCNGLDDDCNGKVDDLVETCFPEGSAGCEQRAGQWTCSGSCATGTRSCRDGQLSECMGALTPGMERCTQPGDDAQNEDCDQNTDEGCVCDPAQPHTCYDGRDGTGGVGKCKAGTQSCTNGVLGQCEGEVLPVAESCDNPGSDDDCNGQLDDIVPALGTQCAIAGARGPCASGSLRCKDGRPEPTCVSDYQPMPEACNQLDDDCNGKADETFNLRRDPQNCGKCGHECVSNEGCCAGRCVELSSDDNHCGLCGTRCPSGNTCSNGKCVAPNMPSGGMPAAGAPATGGMSGAAGSGMAGTGGAGQAGGGSAGVSGAAGMSPATCSPQCAADQTCCMGTCVDMTSDVAHCGACGHACTGDSPGCCKGQCVDLLSDTHCGTCDHDCSLLSSSSITCTCARNADGTISCMGPVLNVCL